MLSTVRFFAEDSAQESPAAKRAKVAANPLPRANRPLQAPAALDLAGDEEKDKERKDGKQEQEKRNVADLVQAKMQEMAKLLLEPRDSAFQGRGADTAADRTRLRRAVNSVKKDLKHAGLCVVCSLMLKLVRRHFCFIGSQDAGDCHRQFARHSDQRRRTNLLRYAS